MGNQLAMEQGSAAESAAATALDTSLQLAMAETAEAAAGRAAARRAATPTDDEPTHDYATPYGVAADSSAAHGAADGATVTDAAIASPERHHSLQTIPLTPIPPSPLAEAAVDEAASLECVATAAVGSPAALVVDADALPDDLPPRQLHFTAFIHPCLLSEASASEAADESTAMDISPSHASVAAAAAAAAAPSSPVVQASVTSAFTQVSGRTASTTQVASSTTELACSSVAVPVPVSAPVPAPSQPYIDPDLLASLFAPAAPLPVATVTTVATAHMQEEEEVAPETMVDAVSSAQEHPQQQQQADLAASASEPPAVTDCETALSDELMQPNVVEVDVGVDEEGETTLAATTSLLLPSSIEDAEIFALSAPLPSADLSALSAAEAALLSDDCFDFGDAAADAVTGEMLGECLAPSPPPLVTLPERVPPREVDTPSPRQKNSRGLRMQWRDAVEVEQDEAEATGAMADAMPPSDDATDAASAGARRSHKRSLTDSFNYACEPRFVVFTRPQVADSDDEETASIAARGASSAAGLSAALAGVSPIPFASSPSSSPPPVESSMYADAPSVVGLPGSQDVSPVKSTALRRSRRRSSSFFPPPSPAKEEEVPVAAPSAQAASDSDSFVTGRSSRRRSSARLHRPSMEEMEAIDAAAAALTAAAEAEAAAAAAEAEYHAAAAAAESFSSQRTPSPPLLCATLPSQPVLRSILKPLVHPIILLPPPPTIVPRRSNRARGGAAEEPAMVAPQAVVPRARAIPVAVDAHIAAAPIAPPPAASAIDAENANSAGRKGKKQRTGNGGGSRKTLQDVSNQQQLAAV